MIGNLTVNISAKDPTKKCETLRAFVGSPSNVRIVGVPPGIGKWKLTKVYFTVNYPDNQSVSKECTAGVGVYVATVPGSSLPGTSLLGYSVKADGTDESGSPVVGYVLGKGDVEISDADGTVTAGETTHYVHVLASCPENPQEGDAYVENGTWKCYNGTAWTALGGVSAGNSYVMSPVANGGDGKWHRMLVVDGTLAFDQEGIDEPPLAADKPWVLTQVYGEATARESADMENAAAISAEATARAAAISEEASARAAAISEEASARDAAVSGEASVREAADMANAAAISEEASERAAADMANAAAISEEASERAAAISGEASERAAAVTAEASERANADTALTNALNQEIGRAQGVESSIDLDIDQEATARAAADVAEAAARASADASEAAERAAADATKVPLDGAATVNGVKTFTSSPEVPTVGSTGDSSTKAASTGWVTSKLTAWWNAINAAAVSFGSSVTANGGFFGNLTGGVLCSANDDNSSIIMRGSKTSGSGGFLIAFSESGAASSGSVQITATESAGNSKSIVLYPDNTGHGGGQLYTNVGTVRGKAFATAGMPSRVKVAQSITLDNGVYNFVASNSGMAVVNVFAFAEHATMTIYQNDAIAKVYAIHNGDRIVHHFNVTEGNTYYISLHSFDLPTQGTDFVYIWKSNADF